MHPALFAAVYKAADSLATLCSLSTPQRSALLLWAPKLTQAVFAALGDFYTWRLAATLHGEDSTASTAAVRSPLIPFFQVSRTREANTPSCG
ncbi:hypothetical protein IMZ48_13965 [Candidatus Bathyarchaeota archaeon]|nr:hypothetical protein [Candidatus Bathyarchaeota archaeon]